MKHLNSERGHTEKPLPISKPTSGVIGFYQRCIDAETCTKQEKASGGPRVCLDGSFDVHRASSILVRREILLWAHAEWRDE
jgi:hypothetical protein